MKPEYTQNALGTPEPEPGPYPQSLLKQAAFLVANLHHPSLHAKKYSGSEDKWQARINRSWRFYFRIVGDRDYSASQMTRVRR